VRSATKTFVGLAGIGIMVAAAKAGMPITGANALVANTANTDTSTPTASPTPNPTSTSTPQPTATAAPSKTKPTVTKPTTTKPTQTATPTPTPTPTPTQPTGAASKTGSAINYRFGTIQVKVTKSGSSITDVTYLQSSYTRAPRGTLAYLVSASIQANGSNFANVSGATYTTDAYKQALESALGKF